MDKVEYKILALIVGLHQTDILICDKINPAG